jgi:hypothetical protein
LLKAFYINAYSNFLDPIVTLEQKMKKVNRFTLDADVCVEARVGERVSLRPMMATVACFCGVRPIMATPAAEWKPSFGESEGYVWGGIKEKRGHRIGRFLSLQWGACTGLNTSAPPKRPSAANT